MDAPENDAIDQPLEQPQDDVPPEPPPEPTPEPDLEKVPWEPVEAPPPPPPKKPKWPWIAGIAALCILAVIAAILLLRWILPLLGGQQSAPKIIPADMPVYASVDVDLADVKGFQHLAEIYGDIRDVEDALDDFRDDLEDDFDITWEDDIQPWLGGEVVVAISDLQVALEGYEEPSMVVAVQTRNRKKSDDFVDKVLEAFEDLDYDVDKEEYEKVDYYSAQPDNEWGQVLYLGTVKDFLVLATDEAAMEDVIDTSKRNKESLSKSEVFADVMAALPADAVAYVVLDATDLMDTAVEELEQELGYSGVSVPRETLEQIEAFQGLGMSLGLHEDGVRLDVAARFDPDKLSEELAVEGKASPNRILKRVPDDALGFYSGQGLATAWETAWASLMDLPDAEEQIQDLTAELGIDIDQDTLSWLSGEFAIAVVESNNLDYVPVGGFAVFEVDDVETAESTLEDLVGTLAEFGDVLLDEDEMDGVDMRLLIDPWEEEVMLGYGFDDDNLIIGFTEDGLESAVDDFDPVTKSDNFKAVRKRLPRKNAGYLYANVEEILELAVDTMDDWSREEYEEYYEPYVDPIKAVGLAVSPQDIGTGVSSATLFVYIP
jgi:hypothetical protein